MKRRRKNREKQLTLPAEILILLFGLGDVLSKALDYRAFDYRRLYRRLPKQTSYLAYYKIIQRLEARGLITIYKPGDSKFIKLTDAGQLRALFEKARAGIGWQKWDGKWRVIVFDIPEDARDRRHQLRRLLRAAGFKKLQASVFISPYALSREFIRYLREHKLDNYIRVMRVDEIDSDADLKNKFALG